MERKKVKELPVREVAGMAVREPEYALHADAVAIFTGLHGMDRNVLTTIRMLKGKTQDAFGVKTEDDRIMFVVAKKGAFLALQAYTGEAGAHGLNLGGHGQPAAGTFILRFKKDPGAGYDPTRDGSLSTARDLKEVWFRDDCKVKRVQATWHTEDWVTIKFDNGSGLNFKADERSIAGILIVEGGRIQVCQFGDPNTKEPVAMDLNVKEAGPWIKQMQVGKAAD